MISANRDKKPANSHLSLSKFNGDYLPSGTRNSALSTNSPKEFVILVGMAVVVHRIQK